MFSNFLQHETLANELSLIGWVLGTTQTIRANTLANKTPEKWGSYDKNPSSESAFSTQCIISYHTLETV